MSFYTIYCLSNYITTYVPLRWKYSEICNKENCPHVGATEKCGHVARKDKCIPYQLQRLFLQLQTVDKRAVETTDVTKSFGWDSSEGKNIKEIHIYTYMYVLTMIAILLIMHISHN